ncbi:hypothetical protein BGZ82_001229 [Podila clonocystis]|nr:hypothetical protein BGZ82_001229 [Podila clonocystis]
MTVSANIYQVLGIPYAKAPAVPLRFAAPKAKAPFTSILNATHIEVSVRNLTGLSQVLTFVEITSAEQEDSLLEASSFSMLAPSRGGMVLVIFNYRLDILGVLENTLAWSRDIVPEIQAILGQVLAFQWVKNSIADFEGDPNRLTTFGESAEGMSTRVFLLAPSTFGLYSNVISKFDPFDLPFHIPESATRLGQHFIQALGCAPVDLDCARSKTADQIMAAKPNLNTKVKAMWSATREDSGRFVPIMFPKPVLSVNASAAFQTVMVPNRTAALFELNTFHARSIRH